MFNVKRFGWKTLYLCSIYVIMDLSQTVTVITANESHVAYIPEILSAIETAAKNKNNSIVMRSPEYLACKMKEGKAVLALKGTEFVGFCYIETWQRKKYVANSGLIVRPEYRGQGVARLIKQLIFEICRKRFPQAKIFGLTKSMAVRKINASLGFEEVSYSKLTTDPIFWEGCSTCPYYHKLLAHDKASCECIGMLYDPESFDN